MKGYYLALLENNGIRAALPLFEVKSRLTGRRLVSVPFATLCDPLITAGDDMRELLDSAVDLLRDTGASHIEIKTLGSPPLISDPRLSRICFFKHHYLEMDGSPEQLLKSFHASIARMIKKTGKAGIYSLRIADDISELRRFYRLFVETRKRLGLPSFPYPFFESLWKVFFPLGMLTLLLAKSDNEYVAGHIYLKFNNRVSMEFEGWDRRFQNMGPNHYLFWEEIKSAHSEGFRIFDFGRTSPNNSGLMRFKDLWATKVIELPHFYYPGNPDMSHGKQENSAAYKLMRLVCRRSPLWASPYIGGFCYRHLG
jgi:lipid II:glycine glycyltransferase (peptidoglycan interpeptide bridge formation enzyme)